MNASISVILPFRDAGATLDAALAQLLPSEDPSCELLAIDDGSTDSGPSRVQAHARLDPRVRLLTNYGRGLVAALQTGLAQARGALIARMDADDIAHPERLTCQRAWLLSRPDIAVLGTAVCAFSDAGPVGDGLLRYVAWQNGLLTPDQHRLARFIEAPLCHPTAMIRREALAAVGGYRACDGPEDYELWLRLIERGHQLAKLERVLLHWRHGAGRATFGDARYGRDRFRQVKAPYLACELRRTANRRLVIWGAGRTGRRLARALASEGQRAARFVDIDPNKIGRSAQGAPIGSCAELDPTRDLVLVAVGALGARALIARKLAARGFIEGESAWFAS